MKENEVESDSSSNQSLLDKKETLTKILLREIWIYVLLPLYIEVKILQQIFKLPWIKSY